MGAQGGACGARCQERAFWGRRASNLSTRSGARRKIIKKSGTADGAATHLLLEVLVTLKPRRRAQQ
eukprot:2748787-Prymnesium_polylepis.1